MATCLAEIPQGTAIVLASGVAAVVGSASWLGKSAVSGFLWYFNRRSREIERMVALHAEITANLVFQKNLADPRTVENMRKAIEADAHHRFFIPLYKEDVVFDRLKIDITDLPEEPIDEVIDYYNRSNGLDVVMERMESERYETLSAARRIRIIESLSDLAVDTVASGNAALAVLELQMHRSGVQKYALLGIAVLCAVFLIQFLLAAGQQLQKLATLCFSG